MTKFHAIKLTNLTPLHLGTGNENYDFSADALQSDTLSASLTALRCMKGKTMDTARFLSSFTISSAFPFCGEHYFLPRPQGKLNKLTVQGQTETECRKKLKKVKFIDRELWYPLICGQPVNIKPGQLQGELITTDDVHIQISQPQVMQRVYVPRNGEDAQPFFFTWDFFRPDAGLYCLIDADTETFKEIHELFIELGENGIGTDRNIGGGKFNVETDLIELPQVKDANATLLLSLYLPEESEIVSLHLSESRYTLLTRNGFIAGSTEPAFRHLRKKSIYMFGCGSLFQTVNPLYGKVVNLAPEWNDPRMHPVYRSGKPLSIFIKQ